MRYSALLLLTILPAAPGCTPQVTGWRWSAHPNPDLKKERVAGRIDRYRAIRSEIDHLERLRKDGGRELPETPESLPIQEFFFVDSDLEPTTANRFRYSFREDRLTGAETHVLDLVLYESELPEKPPIARRTIEFGPFDHFGLGEPDHYTQLISIRSDSQGSINLSMSRQVHAENGLFASTADTQLLWAAGRDPVSREAALCLVSPKNRLRAEVALFECSQRELVDLIRSSIVRLEGTHGLIDWEPSIDDQEAVLWFLKNRVPGGEAVIAAARSEA